MGKTGGQLVTAPFRALRTLLSPSPRLAGASLQVSGRGPGSLSRGKAVRHMAEDTVFARIARGDVSADIVYEDEHCVAFKDVNPQAPIHILVIPRQTLTGLDDPRATPELLGHLARVCVEVARRVGIAEDGYRVVVNVGRNGGQSVAHLHYHLLGGRVMTWPPG